MKYTVWVKHNNGYGARTEEAESPEAARASVQAKIDEGLSKYISFGEALLTVDTTSDFKIVGVESKEESDKRHTVEDVEKAFGLEAA